ncbi:MAG: phosphotransferase enzyme family protein [Myxococcota bacterium]
MPMTIEELDPLAAWEWSGEPIAGSVESHGLINETWGVAIEDEAVAVLQKLNTSIFDPVVHLDIEAITARLTLRGRVTPRLIRTRQGNLWHTDVEGGVWRCLTWVGDRTIDQLSDPADAESAGHLVARFHAALFDLDHSFHFERPGAHDTPAHMGAMQNALVTHRNHRLRRKVQGLADQIWEQWGLWEGESHLPLRVIHGDLKISNLRFTGDTATSLIDLDTLQRGTLDAELGDALRSWCNPSAEDDLEPRFDLGLFEAAMRGYVAGARGLPLTKAEWASIVPGVERITLELASRFVRDALEERYFGWNPAYGTPGEHNLVRAQAMTELAASVHEVAGEAEAILRRIRDEQAG